MKSSQGNRVLEGPKRRRSLEEKPLTSIILRHEFIVDNQKANHDNNDSHGRKLKHCKRLMAMPMRLFSLITNPTREFNQRALSVRGHIGNHYLSKVAPCATSRWRLCPQASKAPASRTRGHQHMGDQARVNDLSRNRP